jgi:hypothetical protein
MSSPESVRDLSPRRYHADGTLPAPGVIFVFGSNEAGRHGAGAALAARNQFGARYGVGVGRTGDAYAIPTKNRSQNLKLPSASLTLEAVRRYVDGFIEYASAHPELTFFVTRIGCGYAQLRDSDVAPLFALAPGNCTFAVEWKTHLEPASPKATHPVPARHLRP